MGYAGTVGQVTELASAGTSAVTTLINGVFNVSGSGYPKPAPAPLPYTVSQVSAMLSKSPAIFASLVKHIRGASPVDVRRVNAGSIPTVAELQASVGLTAQVGLALANAQGAPHGNISIGEANCRAVVQQGMLNFQTTAGQGETITIPGTNTKVNLPLPKTVSTSGFGIVAGLAVGGALLVARSGRKRR